MPTYYWKNFYIDFVTGLPASVNWKDDSYDSILIIVDRLTKMVYYKSVKDTIDILRLSEAIIDVIACHHGVFKSIITNISLLLMSKFRSLLCYFIEIKKKLFTAFYSQTNG